MAAEHTAAAAPVREPSHLHYGSIIGQGLLTGLVAGLVLTIYESLASWVLVQNIFGFIRLAGATIVGEQALSPEWNLTTAGIIGLVVIAAFSLVAGGLFALILGAIAPLHSNSASIVSAGLAYGLLLWLVVFYVLAPALNWSWLAPNADSFWQGFLGFTVFYGLVQGLLLARKGLFTVP
ncbi:MAG: hypothetical protein ACOCXC_05070 [Fibrobacterota bacterium]